MDSVLVNGAGVTDTGVDNLVQPDVHTIDRGVASNATSQKLDIVFCAPQDELNVLKIGARDEMEQFPELVTNIKDLKRKKEVETLLAEYDEGTVPPPPLWALTPPSTLSLHSWVAMKAFIRPRPNICHLYCRSIQKSPRLKCQDSPFPKFEILVN